MYITWKSVTSTTNKVVIVSMPQVSPEIRTEVNEVEGRDGAIVTELGRRPYIQPVEITLLPDATFDTVKVWLTGSGVLIRSDDSTKYVNARIVSQLDYAKFHATKSAVVYFLVEDPYQYVVAESDVTKTSFPATYTNSGSVVSNPLLKVTGSGTVVFVVNGVSVTYVFDTAYVYLDCNLKEAYHLNVLKNRNLTLPVGSNGQRVFPSLSVGVNNITITSGTITEIVITPRTRFV